VLRNPDEPGGRGTRADDRKSDRADPAAVRAALLEVDRKLFVRTVDQELAYENIALPLDTTAAAPSRPVADLVREFGSWLGAAVQPEFAGSGATISQPLMYMLAFKLLELAPGHRYLELGTGTGYGAALAAHVVGRAGRVTSVDVDAGLIATARGRAAAEGGIEFLHGDGMLRPDLIARAERCWVTFSVTELPAAVLDALPEGAKLLAPVGPPPPTPQRYLLYTREAGRIRDTDLGVPVFFIPRRTAFF
jgi:protein-L-isoaspartate O-methyltransferase